MPAIYNNEGQGAAKHLQPRRFFFSFSEDYISVVFALFDNNGKRHVAGVLGQIQIQDAAPAWCAS